MDFHVFLAVLGAALCHAAWNAGLKMRIEPGLAVTILAMAGGLVSLPLLAVTGWPAAPSWPWLATSIALHVVYFTALAEAYRAGDLGQVYPIARGTAPLLTAVGSLVIFRDWLGPFAMAGIIVLTAGIVLLSLRGGRADATDGGAAGLRLPAGDGRAVGFALLTAVTIAAYTLVDGRGARASGNPHAYAVAFFILNGLAIGLIGAGRQPRELAAALRTGCAIPLGGGALSFISYWVALWAMTLAPIPLVAAVRETSVLFAALIGVVLLKEPLIASRLVAAGLVLGGLALIRLYG